jgi:hypothetical protein
MCCGEKGIDLGGGSGSGSGSGSGIERIEEQPQFAVVEIPR